MKRRHREIRTEPARSRPWLCPVLLAVVMTPRTGSGQTVVATVPVGSAPEAVATDASTNKIYSANFTGKSATIIDGATYSTTTIPTDLRTFAVAVNAATNRVYVASIGDGGPFGSGDPGMVTVIDGNTNSVTTVVDPNADGPRALAVNEVTNKIYVANFWSRNVTVIDGATNLTTTITDPNASGLQSIAIAVNSVTNTIYVLNNNIEELDTGSNASGNITVIDGASNSTTTITDPNAITPMGVAVNATTNKVYVANIGGGIGSSNQGNVTVIDGATNSTVTVTDPNANEPGGPDSRATVAVDSTTNKIYVLNEISHNITVIDGATNSTITISDPNALAPVAVALNSATNTIYVANGGCLLLGGCNNPGSVTVINGENNAATTIIDANANTPNNVAVNEATDTIYVANLGGNVSVIGGGVVPTSHVLAILLAGNGSGTVTSTPAGIHCGATCFAAFTSGTGVSLNASANSGSFAGFSGACSGTGTCMVTMNQDTFVTVAFNSTPPDFSLQPYVAGLNVNTGGQASDLITILPLNGIPFGSAIQLSCTVSGQSPMPTCGLSSSSVTPGAVIGFSTLTVTIPAVTHTSLGRAQLSRALYFAGLSLMFGITLIAGSRNRRWRSVLLPNFLLLAFLLETACGGSGSSITIGGGGGGGTKGPSNYIVTVTGTSGTIQHTTQVTVTVQ